MKGENFANRPHCPPGSSAAVKQHASIATGSTMAPSPRTVKTGLGMTKTGVTKAAGLSYR